MVINKRYRYHYHKTYESEYELTLEIIVAVAYLVEGDGVARREHHRDADGEQHQDQHDLQRDADVEQSGKHPTDRGEQPLEIFLQMLSLLFRESKTHLPDSLFSGCPVVPI